METVVIKRNMKKHYLKSSYYLVFLLIAFYIAGFAGLDSTQKIVVFSASILLFIFGVAYFLRGLRRRVLLVADNHGINDYSDAGLGFIAWQEIERFEPGQYGGRNIIAVILRDYEGFHNRCAKSRQRSMKTLSEMGKCPTLFYADVADLNAADILAMLQTRLARFRED